MVATSIAGTCVAVAGAAFTTYSEWGRARGRHRVRPFLWHRWLAAWGVVGAADERAEVEAQAAAVYNRLVGSTGTGGGVGMLLAGLVVLGMSQAGWSPSDLKVFELAYLAAVLGLLLGGGLGCLLSLGGHHQVGGVTYADLAPRRLSDYRSPLFGWVPVAYAAGIGLLTLVAVPAVAAMPPAWTGERLGVLGAMGVTILVGEALMRRVVAAHRLMVTADPATSRRADDMVRAVVISLLQGFVLFALGFMSLILGFHSLHRGVPIWVLMAVELTVMLPVPAGAFAMASGGRLGGTLTHWPMALLASLLRQ